MHQRSSLITRRSFHDPSANGCADQPTLRDARFSTPTPRFEDAAGNESSRIRRGNGLTPSVMLRVGVTSGRGQFNKRASERSRWASAQDALDPHVRQTCRCAELAPLFRNISLSLPFEGAPVSLRPGLFGANCWLFAPGSRAWFVD
jgi:hypothetical protein